MNIEFYPKFQKDNLFYIEFFTSNGSNTIHWTLFKRQRIIPKDQLKNKELEMKNPLFFNEGHPWNLGGGIVNTNENMVDMNTRDFIEFIVDSLNKNSESF